MAKILITDDSVFLRNVLKNTVGGAGHTFSEAADGNKVIELIEKEDFDCILLDLLMPNMDGFEVLQELKNRGNKIPIVVISADIQESTKKICYDLGISDFLHKPPKAEEILNAINKIL